MVKGGSIPSLPSSFIYKVNYLVNTMFKRVMTYGSVFYLDTYDVPEYHKVVKSDPRINKQLSINYVACKSLIEVSNQETDYMYYDSNGRIKVCCFKTGQVVWVNFNEISMYICWNLKKIGSFITENSFNRIFNLCKELTNNIHNNYV